MGARRLPHPLRLDRPRRLVQPLRDAAAKRGSRGADALDRRQRLRQLAALFRQPGPAHPTDPVSRRQGDDPGVESRNPPGVGRPLARAGRAGRDVAGQANLARGNALPHAAAVVSRRRAHRLQLAPRQPVQQPVRASGRGRRALSTHVWRVGPLRSPLVAGRRVDRLCFEPARSDRPAAAENLRRRRTGGRDSPPRVPPAAWDAQGRRYGCRHRAAHGSADSSARRGRQGIRPARSVPAGRRARPAPGLLPRKRGVFARLAGRAGLDPGDQGIRAQAYRGRRRGGSRRRCLAPPVSGTLYRLQGSGLVQRQRPRTHELRRQPAQHAGEFAVHGGRRGSGRGRREIANKDNRIFDHQYFNGAFDRVRSTPQRILAWGQEYRPPFYGHINFINLTERLLSPYTTGYEGTAIESLYPSNTDIFRMAREQGALGGYVHPYGSDPPSAGYAGARGFPVDLALAPSRTWR